MGRRPLAAAEDAQLVLSIRRPSSAALARLVQEQAGQELTYREVGATRAEMPTGYRHDRWEADLGGFDEGRFGRAADALGRWEVQRGAGLTILADGPVEPNATFAMVIGLPGGYVTAAGRVVYVVDEPQHFGFAYGTLPGHPEQGEEAFEVLRSRERLLFRVVAFSRPRHPLARLGAPVTRAFQLRINRAYLNAMRQIAGLP
jgi:uncharacterized protein (UPF0548 family)